MDQLKLKIIFLGDPGVGKSSILNRYTQDKFDSNYQSTIGLDFHTKNIDIENKKIKLLLYDTAGQEKFRSLIPMYIRDANIIIIVYDITNKESFGHTSFWMNEIKDLKREDSIIALVGNKIDLSDRRAVLEEEAKSAAINENLLFSEVSAKTGKDIYELFVNQIYTQIAEKFKLKLSSQQQTNSASQNGEAKDNNKYGEDKNGKKIYLTMTEESSESEGRSKRKCCK